MAAAHGKRRSASSLARHVDAHVGRRIRDRRSELAVSRSQLASMLRISQEQIRRYEAGLAAIVASRLHEIGDALGVPASHFFDGMPESVHPGTSDGNSRLLEARSAPSPRELRKLVDVYWKIAEPALRHQVLTLIQTLSDSEWGEGPSPTK